MRTRPRRAQTITLLTAITLLGSGCGVDQELLANALVHRCELTKLEAELANTTDAERVAAIKKDIQERALLLKTVTETAPDQAAFRAALQQAKCPS